MNFISYANAETKASGVVLQLHSNLKNISNNNLDDKSFQKFLNIIKNVYDVDKMGSMIIGVKWKRISTDKKKYL